MSEQYSLSVAPHAALLYSSQAGKVNLGNKGLLLPISKRSALYPTLIQLVFVLSLTNIQDCSFILSTFYQ